MTPECGIATGDLGAYLDGELRGSELLRVSQHVATCERCAEDLAELRGLGGALRSSAAVTPSPAELNGLAGGVIARMRAEAEHSWSGTFERASADWHWAIVGAGSVVATAVSTAVLSFILAFGPGPGRDDSLAALMSKLDAPPNAIWVYGTFSDADRAPEWIQVQGPPGLYRNALRTDLVPSDAELATWLADTVTRRGRVVSLDTLSHGEREAAERYLEGFSRPMNREPSGPPAFNVIQVRVFPVTPTSVSANGL